MKKLNYLLFLIVANFTVAQSLIAQQGVEFSVVAGLNKSSIVGDSDSWKDPLGVVAGVIANIKSLSTDVLSFRGELQISQQGARWEEDWGEGLVSGKTRLLYINLPLVVRYQFKNGIFAEAGAQPGVLISARDKYEGESVSYMDYVNKFDLAIPLGAGYEFSNNIGIGIRVIPGLLNINSDNTWMDRNLVGSLRVTYTFRND